MFDRVQNDTGITSSEAKCDGVLLKFADQK